MSKEDLLTTMFAVHGKRPMDAQFNEYLKIFDKLGNDASVKLFKHVRDREDKFPTIKQLWGIINSLGLIARTQKQIKTYDDCYYCGAVGYVPYLISPKRDKKVSNYTTVVYACKCSAGMDIPTHIPRYFVVHDDVQFEREEGYNYPQLVTKKQREFAEIYLNEKGKDNAETKRKRSRGENTPTKLREELSQIAQRNFKAENG